MAEPSPSLCFHLGYRIKLTNNALSLRGISRMVPSVLLCDLAPTSSVAIQTQNLRRLLHTVEALSELGPALTAEREFSETSRLMLSAIMEAAGAREGALLLFNDKPAMLTSAAAQGFALMPDPAFIPLLPKHVHALTAARGPIVLNSSTYSVFLSSNGNVAPELFKCLAPLKAAGRLAGVVALGRRPGDALYEDSELDALDLLCSYIALAVQNHALTQSIAQRVSENLRLMASLHGFYDNALEAFATAIDVKHVNIHGHSLRVGRYAAAIGEAMGMDPPKSQPCAAPDICTTSEKLPSTAACSARPARSIPKRFAKWPTTPLSATRSSAACNSPGRKFPRRCVGTTNAATAPAIPTN